MQLTAEYFDKKLKQAVKGLATKDDLDKRVANLATKDELRNLATKDELRNLATKAELRNLATKAELKNLATKDDLDKRVANLATKDELRNLATKDDLKAQTKELKAFAVEQTEELARIVNGGFNDIQDRLDVRERMLKLENKMVRIEQALRLEA